MIAKTEPVISFRKFPAASERLRLLAVAARIVPAPLLLLPPAAIVMVAWRRAREQAARLSTIAARQHLPIAPTGWLGPRGNFAPPGAADPFLNVAKCDKTLFTSAPGLINLDTGAPCAHLLAQGKAILARGMTRWAEESCHSSMQYGPTQGTASFRRALSKFLSAEYGPMASTHPDGLMQTSGATHGLALALTTFFGRKRAGEKVAFIEDPSYFLAPNMFREQGFELVPVALKGSEGLDLDLLESAVLAARERGQLSPPSTSDPLEFSAVVYTIPSFHNPTGATMPAASRQRLVQLARDHNLLIVSDDVYELLHHKHDPSRPHRLGWYDRQLDHGGMHVLGNSTFSKILGPGVRVGWIESHPALIERLSNSATVSSSGASAQLMGSVLEAAMASGDLTGMLFATRQLLARRTAAVQARFEQVRVAD